MNLKFWGSKMDTTSFVCNICGAACKCETSQLSREVASCGKCGSTVRMRVVVELLSQALFGKSLTIDEFPQSPNIRGVGLSDWDEYAKRLEKKLNYTNTFYHQEPRLDITDIAADLAGTCDFLISTDVFEHVEPPVSRAFQGARELLKSGGTLILTVPYALESTKTLEHYPNLHEWELKRTEAGEFVVVNRCKDGTVEEFPHPIFHGGPGTTLEMRLFSQTSLLAELEAAGFRDVRIADDPCLQFGIIWPQKWSLPIVARA